jgi:hypothetical protein
MSELAIFNEWIVRELAARGYEPIDKSKLAWFFEDSPQLEVLVTSLAAAADLKEEKF